MRSAKLWNDLKSKSYWNVNNVGNLIRAVPFSLFVEREAKNTSARGKQLWVWTERDKCKTKWSVPPPDFVPPLFYLRFYFRLTLDELRENKRNCLVCTLTTWRCKKLFSDIWYFISQGFHGIEEEVFLSLPCVLGSHGIICVIKQTLDESEAKQLQECAHTMHEIQESLQFWAFSGSHLCDCKFYLWRWQSHCVFIVIVLSKDKIDQTQLAQVVYHLQIIIRCL